MIKEILDWSEAWAVLIPLATFFFYKKQPRYFWPVIIYLCLAFLLSLTSDIIWKQNKLGLKLPTHNNNPFYNLHSIVRLLCFATFFIYLKQPFLSLVKRILPLLFLIFVGVNFAILENFFQNTISATIHTVEAGILLFYCLQYFLFLQKGEQSSFLQLPHFWVVVGLSIFVTTSFPIYFFYESAVYTDLPFAITVWQVQKLAFLILCFFIARAFYVSNR
jgi:hypothetical protein